MKQITLMTLFLAGCSAFSQTIKQEDVVNGLTGKWRLEYGNELLEADSTSLIAKQVVILKKQSGKESIQLKDGSGAESSIKWKFIDSNKGTAIVFNGGVWLDDQTFIIREITPEKITMLSCSKHDNCDDAYFIKE